jgi:hypothetical protein
MRRRWLALATIFVVSWATSSAAAALPEGSPRDAGDVVIVDGSGQPLTGAGSATIFSLRLPADATCPGDSMHDQWRIQSFLVPSTVDVGSLAYNVIGPEGDAQFALYTTADRPFTDQNLLPNSEAGALGIIPALPTFYFTRFPVGILPAGTYRAGIACTFFRETATYWDIELVVTATPDDEPAQFVWNVAGTPKPFEPSSGNSSDTLMLLSVLGGCVVAAFGGLIWWHRSRVPTLASTQKEPS